MRKRRESPKPIRYSQDFIDDALRLIERCDEPVSAVAARLGMNQATLRGWYRGEMAARKTKAARPRGAAPASPPESAEGQNLELKREIEQLRKKVAQLEMDREILNKAAAFFAKESE
jgi:transposase